MILSGWKEIASYLHCGVRTVQRWEMDGLPVRRPLPGKRSHVIAHSEELDRWVRYGNAVIEYPHLSASLTRAQRLHAEARTRIVELNARIARLRDEVAELHARRQCNHGARSLSLPQLQEQEAAPPLS
jgi:phage terminase Nu1 subunit (DNA packaging protein)